MALFGRKKSRCARLEQRAERLLAQARTQVHDLAGDAASARDTAAERAHVVAAAVKSAPGAGAPGEAGRQAREAARQAAESALALWEQGEDRARATARRGEALERAAEERAVALARSAEERAAVISRVAEERATALARSARDAEARARRNGARAKARYDELEPQVEAAIREAADRAGEIAEESAVAGKNAGLTFLWGLALGFVVLVFWLGRDRREQVIAYGRTAAGAARDAYGDIEGRDGAVG